MQVAMEKMCPLRKTYMEVRRAGAWHARHAWRSCHAAWRRARHPMDARRVTPAYAPARRGWRRRRWYVFICGSHFSPVVLTAVNVKSISTNKCTCPHQICFDYVEWFAIAPSTGVARRHTASARVAGLVEGRFYLHLWAACTKLYIESNT